MEQILATKQQTTQNTPPPLLPQYPISREIVEAILSVSTLNAETTPTKCFIWDKESQYIWQQVNSRTGKHQNVWKIVLESPGIRNITVAVRHGSVEYWELYYKYGIVQKYFPRLYVTFPREWGTGWKGPGIRWVYAQDWIDGIQASTDTWVWKQWWQSFNELFSRDREKLYQFCWSMIDDFSVLPITFSDIDATVGHNLMYDPRKNSYTLFDIDTIRRNNWWEIYRGLLNIDTLSRWTHTAEQQGLAFFLLRRLYEKYGDNIFAKQEGEFIDPKVQFYFIDESIYRHIDYSEQYEALKVKPNDPIYDDIYEYGINEPGFGFQKQEKWSDISVIVSSGRRFMRISDEVKKFIIDDNKEGFLSYFEKHSGKKIFQTWVDLEIVPDIQKVIEDVIQWQKTKKSKQLVMNTGTWWSVEA